MTSDTSWVRRVGPNRSGAIAVTVAITMPVMIGMAALTIDSSLLYIAKNRLQIAADASALAGAQKLPSSTDASVAAIAIADLNIPAQANGSHVLVSGDVVTGNWNTVNRTFVAAGSPINAVRTTTRRSAANGNPARYYLGAIFRPSTIDLSASAIALSKSGCTVKPTVYQQGTGLPTLTRIITLGNYDGTPGAAATYQETPDKHPVVRIDNSFDGPAAIVLNATGLGRFTINVPVRGQFFVVVTGITNNKPPGQLTTVFTVFSSPGAKSGGTATWVNNIRTANTIVGTGYCPVGALSASGTQLVG